MSFGFLKRCWLCSLFLLPFAAPAKEIEIEPTKKDIVFASPGGEDQALDVYVPDGAGPFPVCVLVHGGGWTTGTKSTLIDPLFEPLKSAGFVVFSINYRLAPKHIFPACAEDVDSALAWVKAHAAEYKGDAKRLALVGESAGGFLVAYAGVKGKESVSAVVAFYPPTDLETRVRNLNKLATAGTLLGLKEMNDEAFQKLKEASPLTHVRSNLPPFYLIHGDKDPKVPYEQSVIFQKKMKDAGNVCELVTIPEGNHGMRGWAKLGVEYKAPMIKWLKDTLK